MTTSPDFYSHLAQELQGCLLYTSDAADERSSVDLGGRRIIKKKTKENTHLAPIDHEKHKTNQLTKTHVSNHSRHKIHTTQK